MLNILGVLMIKMFWLKWMVDFCVYIFVIDEVDIEDLKCFILRIVFFVVFFLDLVLLISINFILLLL